VADICQDLWRNIVRRPAESLCLCTLFEHLSEAKVSQAEITILIHENVLGFEIPVDDLLAVEMADSHDHLHRVEADDVLLEAVVFTEMGEKFTSADESHHKEDFGLGLEYVFHADEEGMISHLQDILLKLRSLYLIIIQNSVFSQRLHRKHFRTIAFQLHKENLPKSASSNNTHNLEILQRH